MVEGPLQDAVLYKFVPSIRKHLFHSGNNTKYLGDLVERRTGLLSATPFVIICLEDYQAMLKKEWTMSSFACTIRCCSLKQSKLGD